MDLVQIIHGKCIEIQLTLHFGHGYCNVAKLMTFLTVFALFIWVICVVICLKLLCPHCHLYSAISRENQQGVGEGRREEMKRCHSGKSWNGVSFVNSLWQSFFPEVLIQLVWSRFQEPLFLSHTAGISYWSLIYRWTFCPEQTLVLALYAQLCFSWDIFLFSIHSFP